MMNVAELQADCGWLIREKGPMSSMFTIESRSKGLPSR